MLASGVMNNRVDGLDDDYDDAKHHFTIYLTKLSYFASYVYTQKMTCTNIINSPAGYIA